MDRALVVVSVLAVVACDPGPAASRTPVVAVAPADVRIALEGGAIAVRVPFTVVNRGVDAVQLDGCGAVLEQAFGATWRAAVVAPCPAAQVPPAATIVPGATHSDAVRFAGDLTGAEPPFWEGTVPPVGRYRLRVPLRLGAQPFGDAAVSNPFDIAAR